MRLSNTARKPLDNKDIDMANSSKNTKNAKMARTIKRIAADELGIATLESQHNDRSDFHDLAVWQIEAIMKLAYQAGIDAANKAK